MTHVAADLRMKLIRALLGARWGYFVSHPAGRFANAISVEAWQAAEAYYEASISIAFLIQLAVYTIAAVMVSWQVAVGAFVCGHRHHVLPQRVSSRSVAGPGKARPR